MGILNERVVLDFYIKRMDEDKIQFLRNRGDYKVKIKEYINDLKNETVMHEKIEICKGLWKVLFEASMSFIDGDKRGYDKLFKYFDVYVRFEELIFASDSFYRDHTMHCLWVYFLGEYIRWKDEFQGIYNNFEDNEQQHRINSQLCSFLEDKLSEEELRDHGMYSVLKTMTSEQESYDSIRCLAALTHDLGYPIKKVYKINKSIEEVMPFFSLFDVDKFGFRYSQNQQSFIEEFIRILSTSMKFNGVYKFDSKEEENLYHEIVKNSTVMKKSGNRMLASLNFDNFEEEHLEIFRKNKGTKLEYERDVDSELRFFNDFEEYNHGIMSAYLLCKTIMGFKKFGMVFSDRSNVSASVFAKQNFSSKSTVLRAISNHTSEGYQIKGLYSHSDFLILMDELEEFSRISRANKNRQYVNEFCKTEIFFKDGELNVEFVFDSKEIDNLDPEFAFKGRCRRFLNLFDIPQMDESLNIRLRCIGKLQYDKNTYELKIGRKYAHIKINEEEKHIPSYLKSNEFSSREEYARMS